MSSSESMGRNIKLICHGTKRGKEGLIKEKHVCYYQNKVQCIIANIANILTNVLIKSFSFLICLPLLKISKKTKTKTTNEQTKTKNPLSCKRKAEAFCFGQNVVSGYFGVAQSSESKTQEAKNTGLERAGGG